jgi:hypothetical protein
MQIFSDALREEGEEAAAEALVGGLVPERGQERLQLFRRVKARDLARRQQAVDLQGVSRVIYEINFSKNEEIKICLLTIYVNPSKQIYSFSTEFEYFKIKLLPCPGTVGPRGCGPPAARRSAHPP